MKKITLLELLLLLMILFSCATAEREHTQFGQFDISFEMNKPYEIGSIDDGVKIRASGEAAEIQILEDKSGLSSSKFDQLINLIGLAGNAKVENLHIDGKDGKLMAMARGGYVIEYSPVDGYYALISSSLPAMETSNLLLSLQIDLKKYTQSAIVHSENETLAVNVTSNQTSNQDDPNLTAQIEIENLHHYGRSPGIGLSQYWNLIGDALREQNKTAAAVDAYDKALTFDPSNSHASFFRG